MSVPNYDVEYKMCNLEKTGSPDMTVDGSSVEQVFSCTVSGNEMWYLESVVILVLDNGSMDYDKFGSTGSALINGCSFVVDKAGTDYIVRDIKTNTDILMAFPFSQNAGNNVTGFLSSNDYYSGSIVFKNNIRLCGADSDSVKVVIKDDLSGVDFFQASAVLWRPIP